MGLEFCISKIPEAKGQSVQEPAQYLTVSDPAYRGAYQQALDSVPDGWRLTWIRTA